MLNERQTKFLRSWIRTNVVVLLLLTYILYTTINSPGLTWLCVVISIGAVSYQLTDFISIRVAPISSGFTTVYD